MMDMDYRPWSKRARNQVESASNSESKEGDEEGEEEKQHEHQENTDDTNDDDEEGEEGDGEEGVEGEEEGEEKEEGADGGDDVEEFDDGGLVFNPNWVVHSIEVSRPPADRMDWRGATIGISMLLARSSSLVRCVPLIHFTSAPGTSTTSSGATSRLAR